MPSSIHRNKLSIFMNKHTTKFRKIKKRAKHTYKKTKVPKNNTKINTKRNKKKTMSLRKHIKRRSNLLK